jgi:NADH-quinone oxidoreductase subunit L
MGIERFGAFLAPVVGSVADPASLPGGTNLDLTLSAVAVGVGIIGWYLARLYYGRKSQRPAQIAAAFPGPYRLLVNKYGIDELYNATIVQPTLLAGRYVLGWLGEAAIIRGSAWLLAGLCTLLGEFFRRWQSGNLRSYSGWIAAGAAVLLLFAAAGAAFGVTSMDFHINWAGR